MRYLFNILTVMLVGWPAVVIGYLFSAARGGFQIGCNIFVLDAEATSEKFCKKERGND